MHTQRFAQGLRLFGLLAMMVFGSALMRVSSAQAAPAVPTNVHALPGENLNGPLVLWDPSTDDQLSEFVIERSWNGGSYAIVGRSVATNSSFIDPIVPFTGSVTYRVKAVDRLGGESGYGTAQPLPLTPPTGRAITVTATAAVTSGVAPLTVSVSTNAAAGAATRWGVEGQLDSSGSPLNYTFARPGVYVVSAEVTRLAAGGSLEFGFAEVLITVNTSASLPLAVAQDLVASSPRRGTVALRWTNPASSATTLQVVRINGPARRQSQVNWDVALDQTSFTDKTAKPGISYSYSLIASRGTDTASSNTVTISAR